MTVNIGVINLRNSKWWLKHLF